MVSGERSTVAWNQNDFPPGLICFNKTQLISSVQKEHLGILLISGNFLNLQFMAVLTLGFGAKGSNLFLSTTGDKLKKKN